MFIVMFFVDFPAFINSILQIKREEFAYPFKAPPMSPARLGRRNSKNSNPTSSTIPLRNSKMKEEINNNKREAERGEEDIDSDPQFKLSVISHSV